MLKKTFDFDGFKAISDEGTFEGLVSPYYPYVDDVGDTVMPSAYAKTLQQKGSGRVLLWQHQQQTPIGEITLHEGGDGLYGKGQLLMSLNAAQEAWKSIKAGLVRGLSIGFMTIRDSMDNGTRKLHEIALYEVSAVTFPAAAVALIQSLKSAQQPEEEPITTAHALISEILRGEFDRKFFEQLKGNHS